LAEWLNTFDSKNNEIMKSKRIAYLLWLISIFGWLGFHRFYLGKIGTGILWIITGGVLGIGSLIDLFTLGGQVDQYNTNNELKTLRATALEIGKITASNLKKP
jgi:TM2 domain-containing membrane protein YozV